MFKSTNDRGFACLNLCKRWTLPFRHVIMNAWISACLLKAAQRSKYNFLCIYGTGENSLIISRNITEHVVMMMDDDVCHVSWLYCNQTQYWCVQARKKWAQFGECVLHSNNLSLALRVTFSFWGERLPLTSPLLIINIQWKSGVLLIFLLAFTKVSSFPSQGRHTLLLTLCCTFLSSNNETPL